MSEYTDMSETDELSACEEPAATPMICSKQQEDRGVAPPQQHPRPPPLPRPCNESAASPSSGLPNHHTSPSQLMCCQWNTCWNVPPIQARQPSSTLRDFPPKTPLPIPRTPRGSAKVMNRSPLLFVSNFYYRSVLSYPKHFPDGVHS